MCEVETGSCSLNGNITIYSTICFYASLPSEISGRNRKEPPAGINWNGWPDCSGICTQGMRVLNSPDISPIDCRKELYKTGTPYHSKQTIITQILPGTSPLWPGLPCPSAFQTLWLDRALRASRHFEIKSVSVDQRAYPACRYSFL